MSPENKIKIYLQNKNVTVAKEIAQFFKLEEQVILKLQWELSEKYNSDIHDFLLNLDDFEYLKKEVKKLVKGNKMLCTVYKKLL